MRMYDLRIPLEIGGEAHVQVAVVHGEQDVDAVLESRCHGERR
jgi:hypothetical protein